MHTWRLPQLAVEFVYTIGTYCILSFAMDGPGALFTALLHVPVALHFDAPWRCTSILDFWRRWDLVASHALRTLVYAPVLEGE